MHEEVDEAYGAPRIHRELHEEGFVCGLHRVAGLMRAAHLRGLQRRRRCPPTTNSKHALPIAPNHLARRFTGEEPDRAWVGGTAYIETQEGWLYLAVLLDLFSRRVVGWAMDRTIDREIALSALEMALGARHPAPGLVDHTDRGSQYARSDYQNAIERAHLVCNMSRKDDCYDNAVAESFFATLKRECVLRHHFATRAKAQATIFA